MAGILWLGVTAHPTAEWIARQLTEAFGWEHAPKYLIRDRDRAYGEVFTRCVRSMGIRDRPTSPRSPWQNGHAERLIGSIRRECLDHVVVFGEQHLRHLLRSYVHYKCLQQTCAGRLAETGATAGETGISVDVDLTKRICLRGEADASQPRSASAPSGSIRRSALAERRDAGLSSCAATHMD